ncbi:hypothetical protein QP363_13280, partial [Corynebacterium sp. UMB6689]|nr:hypothetical protein [Corynebacterium sp. UMB6689]
MRDYIQAKTKTFANLDSKLDYLFENNYYEKEVFDQYSKDFIHEIYQWADDQDESRDFPATVKAVDPAGNEATEPINVTV